MERPSNVNRRAVLGALGAAGATLTGVPVLACALSPIIEEGPFFVDEHLNRSDLTIDTTRPGVASAVPLRLAFRVETLRGSSCQPLVSAQVDVWQADAGGAYSDESVLKTRGERFLRGYQVTDRNGAVRFNTVFPGWYPERTPHVHVKIRTYTGANVARTFVSQLYFDEKITDAVLARGAYATRGQRDTPNARDQQRPWQEGEASLDDGNEFAGASARNDAGSIAGPNSGNRIIRGSTGDWVSACGANPDLANPGQDRGRTLVPSALAIRPPRSCPGR